jgi:uncharacterized protein (TIGR03086 family)
VTAPPSGAPDGPDAQLARALSATEQVVAAVRDEQWTAPTPCEAWTVRDLLGHLVGGQLLVTALLHGEQPPPDRDPLGADPLAAFRTSGQAMRAAFAQPGALERTVAVPVGTVPGAVALHLRLTELLVHGWDLARATGSPTSAPEDLAEQELAFSRAQLQRVPPGRRPFGPSQPVAEDAPALERLAALLGRRV